VPGKSAGFDEAAKLHPAAEPLIVHAALLAPESIPLSLFSQGREKFGEPLATQLEGDGLDEAVAALRTFALIDRETVADERDPTVITDCIRLHRLVRQVAAARCEGEVREGAQRVLVEALVAVYPENIWRDPQTWRLSRRLDSHALALVGDDATAPKGVEQRTADLLSFAGFYRHYALAAYVETRPLYERALAIWEKVLGAEHSGTASSLGNLALLFRDLGRPDKAEPLFLRAIAVGDKALGAEHPDTRRYHIMHGCC
jgi:tetratricopeptide (TPR) repeat protein